MTKSQFNLESLDAALDDVAKLAADPDSKRPDLYSLINRSVVEFTSGETSLVLVQNAAGDIATVAGEGLRLQPSVHGKICDQLKASSAGDKPTQVNVLDKVVAIAPLQWQKWKIYYVVVQPENVGGTDRKLILDLVSEVSFQIRAFEQNRASSNQLKIQQDILNVTQLIKNLGMAEGVEELSYIFSNDLLVTSKSSRVSFVQSNGTVRSVSSVSDFSKRTKLIRTISKLGKLVAKNNKTIVWPQESHGENETSLDHKVTALIKNLGTPFCHVVPLRDVHDEAFGALIFEYFQEQESSEFLDRRMMIEDCVSFSSPLIHRMFSLYKIPGILWFDWLFNRVITQPAKVAARAAVVAAVILIATFLLFFWQRPFEVSSQGTLKPAVEQHIFSPETGDVSNIFVTEGSKVDATTVVADLESSEIEQKLVEVEGELSEIRQRLKDLELSEVDVNSSDPQLAAAKIAAEIEVLKIRKQTQEQLLHRYQERKKSLSVFAPIVGQVTTPNLTQRLTARPLNRGDLMMSVADTNGPWELELLVPDRKVDYLIEQSEKAESIEFNFRLVSDPDKTYVGVLNKIDFRVDELKQDQISFVKVFVDIDEAELGDSLRIGTRVYGSFGCGHRSLFFVLTHEIRNSLREWFFF